MHAPTGREKVTKFGRQHVVALRQPAERRDVHRFRMRPLTHLRKLLRVPQQQQPGCCHRTSDGAGQGKLSGLIHNQQIEALTGNGSDTTEGPRGAAEHKPRARKRRKFSVDRACPGYSYSLVAFAGLFSHQGGVKPRLQNPGEHVLHRGVALRDNAHLPAVIHHKIND